MSKPIEAVYAAIGARMRMIREVLAISQGELAERIGLERTSVVNIEAGRQRILAHQIADIAAALGTSPKNFLKGIWW